MTTIRLLKGGSLNRTVLIDDGDRRIVRKSVSLHENLEYGYRRWYSQLKRQQKYSTYFPGMWPEVLQIGKNDGGMAYFDMPYIEGGHNLATYITENDLSRSEQKSLVELIFHNLNIMHSRVTFDSDPSASRLYIWQEVSNSLANCTHPEFKKFLGYKEIGFNGNAVPSFLTNYEKFHNAFLNSYTRWHEVLTHGNATLENMVYVPQEHKLWFIDPYEENVLDSELSDYSQILQSTCGFYEIANETDVKIVRNEIIHRLPIVPTSRMFNFNIHVNNKLERLRPKHDYIATKLLYISQFIRMLPFKQEHDVEKMKFFYAFASSELHNLILEYGL